MRKKVGTSTYIQRINTLERKLLKHCSKTCSWIFWCIKIYYIQMD